jgi:2,5-diamino-6-(ribosylamino)-4(3H)-pyrimidinone 5'-phosphate reductase
MERLTAPRCGTSCVLVNMKHSTRSSAETLGSADGRQCSSTSQIQNRLSRKTNTPAGAQSVHIARRAESYAISVDTLGKLRWSSNDLSGDHLICLLSERVPNDYIAMLRVQGISYIVSGATSVDLVKAVELLAEHFAISTLLLEGGGHINGGFLQAGLVDEVSLLLLPGIDGRHEIAAVFDGIIATNHTAIPLEVKSVEQREGDALWIRYDVVRS